MALFVVLSLGFDAPSCLFGTDVDGALTISAARLRSAIVSLVVAIGAQMGFVRGVE
jgi:hypothetical protein